MRVAHFVHRYPPALGGAESYFARLSRFLVEHGAAVEVFTTNALDLQAFWSPRARTVPSGVEAQAGVTVRRFPIRYWPAQRYLRKLLSFVPIPRLQALNLPCNPWIPQLWRESDQDLGFDIVHATALPYAYPILCAQQLARACKAPFVLTPFLHLGDPRAVHDRTRRAYLAPALRYLIYRSDLLFVQTSIERNALLGIGVPSERIVLQGLGVDLEECTGGNRLTARKRWRIPSDAVVIGHLANKSVEKGTVDLLHAARLLWDAGTNFHLLLAGPSMPNFERAWAGFPYQDRVCNLGPLSEAEKRDFYAALDVFALPSRSDSFGLVLLEAWANGIPCVGYRAGGVAEVIQHDLDGFLVDCGSVSGLAEALGTLLRNGTLRQRLGQTGRDRVFREHRWPSRLEIVRQAYLRLLASRGAPHCLMASSEQVLLPADNW
jgi:glycosyltransferase involved in cell wall biosynthesis